MILRYAGAVALIALTGAAIIAWSGDRLGEAGRRGAFLGGALAAAGAVGGMALLVRSLDRGPNKFYGMLVAGILGRLALFGTALLYVGLAAPASYSLVALAASLLAFYLIFQWVELYFVLKAVKRNNA